MLDYNGLTLHELLDLGPIRWICEYLNPEDIGDTARDWECALADGKPFERELRVRDRAGVYRWLIFRFKPQLRDDGIVLRWICTATDIEQTKREDERLRLVVDTTPAYIHSALPDGTVDYLNQRWVDYIGLPLQTILARKAASRDRHDTESWASNLVRTVHPDDLAAFVRSWNEITEAGKSDSFEARIRRFDGEYHWFLMQPAPLRDQSGEIVKWYVASVDIDDRVRSDKQLRQKDLEVANQLRIAINTTPFLAWTARPDGSAEFLNDRWLTYSGLSAEQALDWDFLVAVHPDDIPGVMAIYKNALETGDLFEAEARIRRFDGQYRWFLFRGSPFRDDSGTIVRWFGANTDIEDRKRTEEALRASEQSLRLVIETIPGLVHTTSASGELENVSQKELKYFGRTFDEMKDWSSLVHPDDLQWVTKYWHQTIETEEPYDAEERILRSDGMYRWLHVQGVPLRNDLGDVVRWYFLMADVDERHKAAEEIQRRERYLAEGQRLSRTASFSWRLADQKLLYLSEEGYRIFGFFPQADPPGWEQRANYVHPEDIERFEEVISRAITNKSDYEIEYRIILTSGLVKWLRVVGHAVFDAEEQHIEYIGTIIDISEQHKAQEALHETERRLRVMIETIPALVWSSEADGVTTFVNQQFVNYLGRSLEDLLHSNWLDVIHSEDADETRCLWLEALRTGHRYERTHRMRRVDGVYRWFRTIAEPLHNDSGLISGWYGLNIDIDDSRNMAEALRNMQARLSRATQIATIAELSASIAHEINQPLGAVVVNADACEMWLSGDPPNIDRARLAAERIVRDATAAAEVITRIRALFKQAVPNKQLLDLNDVISEVLRLATTESIRKDIRITTNLDANLPKIAADRIQMQQLMLNLVHNAIDSMESVKGRPRLLGLNTQGENDGAILLEVTDSGVGMEDAERLFEPFYTTKDKGMGMGLSICRSIVESHSGSLSARLNEGHGTTFSVRLPVSAESRR